MIKELHAINQRYDLDILIFICAMSFVVIRFVRHNWPVGPQDLFKSNFMRNHHSKFHFASWVIMASAVVLILMNLMMANYFPVIDEDYYTECANGSYRGMECLEDVMKGEDSRVTPQNPDPLKVRD